MSQRIAFAIILLFLLVGASIYFFKKASTPTPRQTIPDLGRDHVADSTPVEYNSNPPTSGPHNTQWERPGIYDRPLNDRKLVHSLEHGYVIISYNCDYKKISGLNFRLVGRVNAHVGENDQLLEETSPATSSSHLDLSIWKTDSDCQKLVSELTNLANRKKVKKLIVVPRPNLDNRIAVTAWARLDKFYDFNENRIAAFIDAYRDHGPEQTME